MLFKIDQVIHEIWLRIMLYLFFGSFRTGYCNMCKKQKKNENPHEIRAKSSLYHPSFLCVCQDTKIGFITLILVLHKISH
jgi:hypothetical protein